MWKVGGPQPLTSIVILSPISNSSSHLQSHLTFLPTHHAGLPFLRIFKMGSRTDKIVSRIGQDGLPSSRLKIDWELSYVRVRINDVVRN